MKKNIPVQYRVLTRTTQTAFWSSGILPVSNAIIKLKPFCIKNFLQSSLSCPGRALQNSFKKLYNSYISEGSEGRDSPCVLCGPLRSLRYYRAANLVTQGTQRTAGDAGIVGVENKTAR